ncbi:UDP-N-acetylmuramoyl-tripeptide--D-alanyl-D-alanine ligase [Solibacillus sp. CAU 1738]|uniref:UDP-N-acetylmuramoyl-tripeptide--D-alanyl-D- alanine ligase n=1 Tax=Solibacillus sp. CAU 1738 TaxID=3140363 RepID=UPI00326043FE
MRPLLIKELQKLLGAECLSGPTTFYVRHAIYYKTHDLTKRNTLVFISKGDEIDWQELNAKGPIAIISDKQEEELQGALSSTTVLKVKNVMLAFWQFVKYYRELFEIPVVALTGTCGKTTTKEMIRHILIQDWPIQTTISSINEPRQSLPYLTGIESNTRAAIFELGLGNSGNISHQCMVYQPTIGIITNIGVHHLDGCKSLDGYIKAKSEIVEGIREGGTLIINADDENSKKVPLHKLKGKLIKFGINDGVDFKASNIQYAHNGMTFTIHNKNARYKVYVPGYGEHQVYNALAAIAAVNEMGISIPKAIARLKTYENMERHLQFFDGIGGCTLIDDTWTNNPTSIEAALKVLSAVSKEKKQIVILGDIKRLGKYEQKYHREIGSLVAKQKIAMLITIGTKAEEIGKQALREGIKAEVHMFKDVHGVMEILKPKLDKQSIVLIKGPMSSKSMIEFARQLKEGNK